MNYVIMFLSLKHFASYKKNKAANHHSGSYHWENHWLF